mmetsp:Transcript_26630/g.87311  ORF Transcript_26630/g.87311 Transcript_26630/m.87311 type:complete len:366 (-) Transcript_26630:996-2093(-)
MRTPSGGRLSSRTLSHSSSISLLPDSRASVRTWSRNWTSASKYGPSVSSRLPPSPASPNPTPSPCSHTPSTLKMRVTYCATRSTRNARRCSAGTSTKYELVLFTTSCSTLIVVAVSMLSQSAACTRSSHRASASCSLRSAGPSVCSASLEYGCWRNCPLTEKKNSANVFSMEHACCICEKPTHPCPSGPETGVSSMGSLHWQMRKRKRIWRHVYMSSAARMVMKFLSDLLILSPAMCKCPVWRKKLTHWRLPWYASDCASWFSWCGKARSHPPPLMSTLSPRWSEHIAEHSMCQPGRPSPHGEAHFGSPALDRFHNTKSLALRFSEPPAPSAPSPSIASSVSASAVSRSLPYECSFEALNAMVSK